MITTFNKGDRVRKFQSVDHNDGSVLVSKVEWVGTVDMVANYFEPYGMRIGVQWDNGEHTSTYESNLELIKNKKTIMTKVSNMMKKLLDSDTQELVKAGYINGDLDMTEEGKNALIAELFVANKSALVDSAKAKNIEEDKNN